MAQCDKCEVKIANFQETIGCVECQKVFHPTCTRIGSVSNFKKLSASRKCAWKCDQCQSETDSNASSRVSEAEVLDKPAVSTILQSIQAMRKDMGSQFEGVKSQLNIVNTNIADLSASLDSLKIENEARKAECKQLWEENSSLKSEISCLKSEMSDMQQYSRRDNVEIVGVPYDQRENIYDILKRIAEYYQIPYSPEDVSIAHRMPDKKKNGIPNIIVKFARRYSKNDWIFTARRSRGKLTGANLNDAWPSHRIYVNDHLTFENKRLLARLREMVRQKKIVAAWTRDCTLMMRVAEGSPVVQVRCQEDIDKASSR